MMNRIHPTDSGCRKASSAGDASEMAVRAASNSRISPETARSCNYDDLDDSFLLKCH